MKKKKVALFLIITIIMQFAIANTTYASSPFAGGDGTEENPYQVSTPEQLNEVRNYLDKYFIQINDIDLTVITGVNGDYYNNGAGWKPIGNETDKFSGTYNGCGYKIIGLKVNRDETCGLFGVTNGKIHNLGIIESEIKGQYAGSIAGVNYGVIINCYNKSTVSNPYPAKNIVNLAIGGIAGRNYTGGSITNCYNTGNISATITASGNSIACSGGITGDNGGGITRNCYNTGKISGSASFSCRVGGIVGSHGNNSTVTNCYWATDVYDSGYHTGVGNGTDSTTGMRIANMKKSAFVNTLNQNKGTNESWHIDNMNLNNGYPVFQYQFNQANPINQNGDLITIKNISDSTCITIVVPDSLSEDIVPIIALYEENSLLNVYTYTDYTLLDNTLILNQVNLNVPPTTTEIKIFVWKDLQTIQPLMECYHIQ